MVGEKSKRVSTRSGPGESAAAITARRITEECDSLDTETLKREELLYEFAKKPHWQERARNACFFHLACTSASTNFTSFGLRKFRIESFEKELHLVKQNLKAVEIALGHKGKFHDPKEKTN